jgi:hypothetical protein
MIADNKLERIFCGVVSAHNAKKFTFFWILTPPSSETAWRFGGIYCLHFRRVGEVCRLLLLVHSLSYPLTLNMKAMCSSGTSQYGRICPDDRGIPFSVRIFGVLAEIRTGHGRNAPVNHKHSHLSQSDLRQLHNYMYILWRVESLLCRQLEANDETTSATR